MENLENLEKCEHCENEFNVEKLTLIDGKYYCEECLNELFTKCENCGDYVLNDDTYFVDGDYLCENCADELAIYCDICCEYHYSENVHETNDGHFICNDCLNDSDIYRVCNDCGTVFNIESEGIYDHDGNYVCSNCADGNYFFCDGCEEYYSYDESDAHDTEDCIYCDNCYEEYEDNNDGDELNNYSYKPELKIFTTGHEKDNELYCGFELETEEGSNGIYRNDMCKILNKEINKDGTFIYFKSDGSLNNGIEVVSHAFTWEYLKENEDKFKKMLQLLSDNGYKSHDTSTCGLHIHINKKYFGNTREEQDKNINKLILFFEYFKEQIKKFSRRTDFHYCNFLSDKNRITDKKQICNIEKIKDLKQYTGRYVTVNIENNNTVEIRVFKGTLKDTSFLASLEFVFNVARVIKENSIGKITFSKVVNFAGSTYIKDYCKERGIVYNYSYLHDYSIEFLRNKTKLEKKAKQLLKNAYALPKQILPIAKQQLPKIYSEIEKAIKNGERIKNCFVQYDLIDKFNYTNNIILHCYMLQDNRARAKNNNLDLCSELREVRDILSIIRNYINANVISSFYDNEYKKLNELYKNITILAEELKEYYKN